MGTGAVATAAVANAWGIGSAQTIVRQPGGDARVVLNGSDATLIGPSQFVCAADFAWPERPLMAPSESPNSVEG